MKAEPVIPFDHRLRRHADFQKMLADPDYFYRRMMASVERPSTVSGEVRQLRTELAELRQAIRGGKH